MRTFVAIEVSDQGVLNSVSQVQAKLNIKAKPVEVHNTVSYTHLRAHET